MMSSTLGAPLGGTIRGGHQGVESFALCLITPPNCGGGGGICFPSMLIVALGEPNCPLTCCPAPGVAASKAANRIAAIFSATASPGTRFILRSSADTKQLFPILCAHSVTTAPWQAAEKLDARRLWKGHEFRSCRPAAEK